MAAKQDQGQYLPVDFSRGTEFPAVHANQMIVQHTEQEFIVTFFELLPPVVSLDPEMRKEQLAQLASIQARPVARVVVSAERMREFIGALVENYQRYEQDVKNNIREEV